MFVVVVVDIVILHVPLDLSYKKGEYLIWAEVDEVVFEYNVCELCGVALGFESFILYNHAAASLCFALNSQEGETQFFVEF